MTTGYVLYRGSRDELNELCRNKDMRIGELEARERVAIAALCKVATGRIGDGWATPDIQWDVCRSIASDALKVLGVNVKDWD